MDSRSLTPNEYSQTTGLLLARKQQSLNLIKSLYKCCYGLECLDGGGFFFFHFKMFFFFFKCIYISHLIPFLESSDFADWLEVNISNHWFHI